jgi:hypothetical protein
MEIESKENEIVDVGNVNVNKENMKEYLWQAYLSGKSLTVTHQVFLLEQKFNALIDAVSAFDLKEEERIILNEFRL